MTKYLAFLIAFCLFIAPTSWAQDIIYKKDNEEIKAKVLSVSQTQIIFKLSKNPKGPDYSLPKEKVLKIKYRSGLYDIFSGDTDKIGVLENGEKLTAQMRDSIISDARKNNIISLCPYQMNDNGYGFGISYERLLNKKGNIGFYLPLSIAYFGLGNQLLFGHPSFTNPIYYISPGFKYYFNLKGKFGIKWSLNPAFLMGFCNGNDANYIYSKYNWQERNGKPICILSGFIINVGGNIDYHKHINFGFDLGLGRNYLIVKGQDINTPTPLFQTSIKVGYRFSKNHQPK